MRKNNVGVDVKSFINQQLGFSKWRNYNSCLQRLRCCKEEEFKGIVRADSFEAEIYDTPVFACKFAKLPKTEHLLCLANEDGRLLLRDTSNPDNSIVRQIHHNAIFDVEWFSQSPKVIAVSGDHTARLVHIANDDMRVEQVFSGHTRSVKTVAVYEDSSVFATGSRDGSIRVWDTRSSNSANMVVHPDRSIFNSHWKTPSSRKKYCYLSCVSAANSVTGLVFQNEDTLISCGSGDGLIKVWDLRKTYMTCKREPHPKWEIPYSGTTNRKGFSNLTIDRQGLKLYANCLDNTIYSYNISTYNMEPVMEYKGFENSTFYIKSVISNDGLYMLSGSSDHNAYIWNLNEAYPVVKLAGHTAEVTCVAWCRDSDLALVTCSDDVRHKIWRVGEEELPDNWEFNGRGAACKIDDAPAKFVHYIETLQSTPTQIKRNKMVTPNKRMLEDDDDIKEYSAGRRLFDVTNIPGCSREDDNLAMVLEEEQRTPSSKRQKMMESTPPDTFSPTTNLPNFVVDGVAPHLHYSPQKRVDKDWLTKMRVEKKLVKAMHDLANGGSPSQNVPKFDERSPRNRAVRRRGSRCGSQSPILKFFRVTNNSIMQGGQNSPKTSRVPSKNASSTHQ